MYANYVKSLQYYLALSLVEIVKNRFIRLIDIIRLQKYMKMCNKAAVERETDKQ